MNTTNTLAWLKECRERNKNAIANTATGEWLRVACQIIEEQFNEIQSIRNAEIDRAAGDHESRAFSRKRNPPR